MPGEVNREVAVSKIFELDSVLYDAHHTQLKGCGSWVTELQTQDATTIAPITIEFSQAGVSQ